MWSARAFVALAALVGVLEAMPPTMLRDVKVTKKVDETPPIPTTKKPDEPVVIVREAGTKDPRAYPTTEAEMGKLYPDALNNPPGEANPYPIIPPGELLIKDAVYEMAAPSEIDPDFQDAGGVHGPTVKFGYNITGKINPMETKTPIYDAIPCKESPMTVTVPAAQPVAGLPYTLPFLPAKYGCSKEKEYSREKASPEVVVRNYTADVVDFSLQMIVMGGDDCAASEEADDDYNFILWHVNGMKADPSGTLVIPEGASHDRRTLRQGVEQPNNYLEEYYSGPCPEPGQTKCYRMKVLGHLSDGKTCMCGYQDFLFERPLSFGYAGNIIDVGAQDLDVAQLPPPPMEAATKRKINFVDSTDEIEPMAKLAAEKAARESHIAKLDAIQADLKKEKDIIEAKERELKEAEKEVEADVNSAEQLVSEMEAEEKKKITEVEQQEKKKHHAKLDKHHAEEKDHGKSEAQRKEIDAEAKKAKDTIDDETRKAVAAVETEKRKIQEIDSKAQEAKDEIDRETAKVVEEIKAKEVADQEKLAKEEKPVKEEKNKPVKEVKHDKAAEKKLAEEDKPVKEEKDKPVKKVKQDKAAEKKLAQEEKMKPPHKARPIKEEKAKMKAQRKAAKKLANEAKDAHKMEVKEAKKLAKEARKDAHKMEVKEIQAKKENTKLVEIDANADAKKAEIDMRLKDAIAAVMAETPSEEVHMLL